MILDIRFAESNQSFDCNFGEINNVSDGGYERGYEKGYEEGFDAGFDDAYKEEQEKSVDITENCTTEITPDENKVLLKVTVKVDVADKSKELENIIDASGVLESTDGTVEETVEEKVEQLIDKAKSENAWYVMSEKWTWQFERLFGNNSNSFKKLPRLCFDNATTLKNFMDSSLIEEVDYYINSPKNTNATACFANTPNLKRIVGINMENCTDGNNLFFNSGIEVIEKHLNFSKIRNYAAMPTFNLSNNLREVRFDEKCIFFTIKFTSSKLSNDSIKSIVHGLAPVETTQILTLNSEVFDRLIGDNDLYYLFDMTIDKNWEIE